MWPPPRLPHPRIRRFLGWLRLRRLRLQVWVYRRLGFLHPPPEREIQVLHWLILGLSLIVLFQAFVLILGSHSRP